MGHLPGLDFHFLKDHSGCSRQQSDTENVGSMQLASRAVSGGVLKGEGWDEESPLSWNFIAAKDFLLGLQAVL